MISKRFKILHQLLFAALISLALVGVMGVIAYLQTNKMYDQTQKLYDHSLKVRRAIGELQTGILSIHREMKDIFLFPVEEDLQHHLSEIARHKADVEKQLDIIEQHYLGDLKEVEVIRQTFTHWNTLREETVRLRQIDRNLDAAARTRSDGVAGANVGELMKNINTVSHWSLENSDKLFQNTKQYNSDLNRQIVFLMLVFMFFLGLVFSLIYYSIQHPLRKLRSAATDFRSGNYSARCNYQSYNEFGMLVQDFNALAETLEQTITLNDKSSGLAYKMLQNHNPDIFFDELLKGLLRDTGAQQGVIYLRNHEQNLFEFKVSIGGNHELRQTFDVGIREGELGQALATGEPVYITGLSEKTRFVFNTSSGCIIPEELVTIPIVAGGDTLAVITMANVGRYSQMVREYLQKVHPILCARVAGILAYIRMERLTEMLEIKNRELELQSYELSQQAIELEQQNMELESQKVQLQEASLLKTSFLSNMSHELRTPLNSVISLSGLLHRRLEGVLSSEEHGYLGIIERNGKSLLELINDILNISKIESGRVEVNLSEFNMNDLLDELLQILDPQAKGKGLRLERTEADSDMRIYSDRRKCYHILQNLIGNAIKFTDTGSVSISVSHEHQDIRIEVQDTGIGVSQEDLPYIFDEFRQVDSSTSRRHEGSGLGLAIAYKYAQILQGNIEVSSIPDEGSVFSFVAPMRYKESEEDTNSLNRPAFSTTSETFGMASPIGKTIMIVEDSEPAIIQLKDFLEDAGFATIVARNGAEALKLLEQTRPNGIILDLMMPEVDGFTVLKTIRESELTSDIPVMILTAKHISNEELSFLKRNNIHQLIYKGDISKSALLSAVITMIL